MHRFISIVSTGISVAMLTTFAFAWTGEPEPEWLPSVADSAGLVTPVVLSGTIQDRTGVTFPEGTQVVLYAYPSQDVLRRMTVGDTITPSPVAKASVGDAGEFELRISDVAGLRRYATREGAVDFEVRAVAGQAFAPFSFSRTLFGSGENARLVVDSNSAAGLAPAPPSRRDSTVNLATRLGRTSR